MIYYKLILHKKGKISLINPITNKPKHHQINHIINQSVNNYQI